MDALFGTTVFVSFLAGMVALLAPCCVSVMLPAFFASTFRRRSQILGMTLVFAAGVGVIILPISLGAAGLSQLVSTHHELIFGIGGLAMIVGGLAMLGGAKLMLPMPSMRAGTGRGVGSVFALGAFSGVASACCAPVLAGVAAVSGAGASFPAAMTVGVAYVFGMVAPLTVLALVWDSRDWGEGALLSQRSVSGQLFGRPFAVPLAAAISGGLMIGMGILTIGLAVRGPSMTTDGWQVRVTAWLTHLTTTVRDAVAWVPGPLLSALVLGSLAGVVLLAVRSARPEPTDDHAREPEPFQTPMAAPRSVEASPAPHHSHTVVPDPEEHP